MNITQIIQDFGAYYIDEDQNRQRLVRLLEYPGETLSAFPVFRSENTVVRFALDQINGDVLQPFQKDFTPRGSFQSDPLTVEQFKMKVNIQEEPDDLEGSWRGFQEDLSENEDRSQWPFIRYFMEQLAIPRLQRNLDDASFWGVRAEPVQGTPGASRAAYNGIRHLINTGAGAGSISPLAVGAVPTDPVQFVDYVEAIAALIPQDYRYNEEMEFTMSKTLEHRYRQGYDLKYNTNYLQSPNTMGLRYFSNLTVVGRKSHEGSTKIWATPRWNRVRLLKKANNIPRWMAKEHDFTQVRISTHFWHGIGFKEGSVVFTNDVDLV